MRAFAQQVGQVGFAFGPWGVALSLAATAAISLYQALARTGDQADGARRGRRRAGRLAEGAGARVGQVGGQDPRGVRGDQGGRARGRRAGDPDRDEEGARGAGEAPGGATRLARRDRRRADRGGGADRSGSDGPGSPGAGGAGAGGDARRGGVRAGVVEARGGRRPGRLPAARHGHAVRRVDDANSCGPGAARRVRGGGGAGGGPGGGGPDRSIRRGGAGRRRRGDRGAEHPGGGELAAARREAAAEGERLAADAAREAARVQDAVDKAQFALEELHATSIEERAIEEAIQALGLPFDGTEREAVLATTAGLRDQLAALKELIVEREKLKRAPMPPPAAGPERAAAQLERVGLPPEGGAAQARMDEALDPMDEFLGKQDLAAAKFAEMEEAASAFSATLAQGLSQALVTGDWEAFAQNAVQNLIAIALQAAITAATLAALRAIMGDPTAAASGTVAATSTLSFLTALFGGGDHVAPARRHRARGPALLRRRDGARDVRTISVGHDHQQPRPAGNGRRAVRPGRFDRRERCAGRRRRRDQSCAVPVRAADGG